MAETAEASAPESGTTTIETPEGVGVSGDYYDEEPDYSDLTGESSPPDDTGKQGGGPPPLAAGEAPAGAPAAAAFSDTHYAWGEHLGLSRGEVEKFGDPKLFERMVYNVSAMLRSQTQQQQAYAAAQQQQQPAQQQIPSYFQPFQPFQFPANEEGQFDPVLVQQNQYLNARFQHMEQAMNQLMHQQSLGLQHVHQQVQADFEARRSAVENRDFDNLVDALNQDELFGKGEYGKLSDKAHQNNRMMLATTIRRLAAGHQALGEEVPPLQALISAAFPAVFGDRIRQNTLSDVARRAQERARQATNPPSRREGRPLNPTERAIKTAAQAMREKGWFEDGATEE